jgi:hypothetical protein
MSIWTCEICKQGEKEYKVRVIKNGKCVHSGGSILKAENYAFKHIPLPCLIKSSYICNRCQTESKVNERIYKNI